MSWQKKLAQGFSSAKDLLNFLALPELLAQPQAEQQFRTRVPQGFAERMQKAKADDPLLLQVLATEHELISNPNYQVDPLNEKAKNALPGLLHKYQGRILLTVTGVCAINCRYCFRRHFPYAQNNPGREGWAPVIDYVQRDSSIQEIILSGGDPLLASDVLLRNLLEQLVGIPHVQTIRFHTRIPIVLPERVDESFISLLNDLPVKKVMVLHCNHAQEIDITVEQACLKLKNAQVTLLNQSVLLKNINDSVPVLAELSQRLFQCGVLPYYLHLLDKVAGAAHYDLPLEQALTIYRQLQKELPGYLVPRLACEQAGQASKTLLV